MRPKGYPEQPHKIWEYFYQISQRPHPSKNEGAVKDYLKGICHEHKFSFMEDRIGNLLIKVPGRGRLANRPVLGIQNHLDMVCDKGPGSFHNFDSDPLQLQIKEDYLLATDTTLGADNGIGVAAALALATTENLEHPPLELLMTIDEETGLGGALNLDSKMISAKCFLNLDTEEWGGFYVGCAGGRDWEVRGDFERSVPNKMLNTKVELTLGSLVGGHSGIDIHRQRGNAIALLAQVLEMAREKKLGLGLHSFSGGKAHNIIPREAKAQLIISKDNLDQWESLLEIALSQFQAHLPKEDQMLTLEMEQANWPGDQGVLTDKSLERFLSFLINLPHGAHSFVLDAPELLVSLSSNLAIVHLIPGEPLYVNISMRYFVQEELWAFERKFKGMCLAFGLEAKSISGYPNWRPNYNYPLLSKAQELYEKLYQKKAKVLAIHAGLECGIIKDKLGEVEILSLGPTIEGAHSPTERVHIPSVQQFWTFLVELVNSDIT